MTKARPAGGSVEKRGSQTPQKILAAATELFLRDGYGNTNLEQVAAAAGVTKPTLYNHFGSKQGLLRAVTQMHASDRAEKMSLALQPTGNPKTDLLRFGDVFLSKVLSHEAACWQRLATSESTEHPEVGQAFFDAGPARVFKALVHYLQGEKRAGRLTCPNPQNAAEHFLGMLIGMDPIRMLTGQPLPTAAQQKRRCREAVDIFLAAFGKSQS